LHFFIFGRGKFFFVSTENEKKQEEFWLPEYECPYLKTQGFYVAFLSFRSLGVVFYNTTDYRRTGCDIKELRKPDLRMKTPISTENPRRSLAMPASERFSMQIRRGTLFVRRGQTFHGDMEQIIQILCV
jgi:hypothetical protein